PTLYSLARTEYGAGGSSSCNSSLQLTSGVSSSCVFVDVTQGDIDMPCVLSTSNIRLNPGGGVTSSGVSNSCYIPSGSFGVLSTTANSSYSPAFTAGVGWDFATG